MSTRHATQASDRRNPEDYEAIITSDAAQSARALPLLSSGKSFNAETIRDPLEKPYLAIIHLVDFLVVSGLAYLAYAETTIFAVIMMYAAFIGIFLWLSWKFTYWFVNGHGIEVTKSQYPQIYSVIKQASDFLEIPIPQIVILQGAGLFELLVAKYFSRRGLLIIT